MKSQKPTQLLIMVAFMAACGGGGGPTCTGIFDIVNSFSFRPVTNAPLNTAITSDEARIEGFCSTKDIAISGAGEYSINGGPFTQQPGQIRPNSRLQVRIVSPATFGTTRSATVEIGEGFDPIVEFFLGIDSSATFSVTTSPGNPAGAPTVQVFSPADQQVVDARSFQVTGQASDPDGISSIEVNGIAATSVDGFATWQAEIPLVTGTNVITIASADSLLNRNPTAAEIRIENLAVILAAPVDFAVDDSNSRILVLDSELGALIEINMITSEHTIISNETTPDNLIPFIDLNRIAVSTTTDKAWVVDHGYEDLITVDLATGSRSQLVDTVATGPGDSLQDARDIALDEISNHALLLVGGLNSAVNDTRVISVDLADGSRFILSDGSIPNSDNPLGLLFNGMSVVFDSVGFRLLVMQQGDMLSVDPLTGQRSVFSDAGIGSAVDATLDLINNRVLISNRFNRTLYGADLNSGNVQSIWPLNSGGDPQRIAFDPLNNRTLVLYKNRKEIFATDMVTGASSIVY